MATASKKTAGKATKKKVDSPQSDSSLKQVIDFLQERIADGGATTDQLQSLLSTINPSEAPSPSAPIA